MTKKSPACSILEGEDSNEHPERVLEYFLLRWIQQFQR